MQIKLKTLTYNHKQGKEATAPLGGAQFIIQAPNGAGKTALLTAVQECLGLTPTDVSGRAESKTLHRTWYAPVGGDALYARLSLEVEGKTGEYTVQGKSRTGTLGSDVGFLDLWALVEKATAGSSETLEAFLYEFLVPGADLEVLAGLEADKTRLRDANKALAEADAQLAAVRGVAVDPRRAVLQAMETLIGFQLEKNICKCACCGGDVSTEALNGRIAAVVEKLDALGGPGVVVDEKTVKLLEAMQDAAASEVTLLKNSITARKQIISDAVKAALPEVLAAVSEHSPEPIYIELARSPEIGMEGAERRPALSGGQRLVMQAALARVAADRMTGRIPVIITPDKALSARGLHYLCAALRGAQGITFIQTVGAPRGADLGGFKPLKLKERAW